MNESQLPKRLGLKAQEAANILGLPKHTVYTLSTEGGPQLSAIRLKLKADVPGIDPAKFRAVADDAKSHCPVSRALSAVPVELEATLA